MTATAICENPKRIISAAILSRRLAISRTALGKHLRRRLIVPDFESDAGSFFNPDRLPELRKTIEAHRARNLVRGHEGPVVSFPPKRKGVSTLENSPFSSTNYRAFQSQIAF